LGNALASQLKKNADRHFFHIKIPFLRAKAIFGKKSAATPVLRRVGIDVASFDGWVKYKAKSRPPSSTRLFFSIPRGPLFFKRKTRFSRKFFYFLRIFAPSTGQRRRLTR